MAFVEDAISFVDTGGVEYPQLYQQVNRYEIPDTKSEEQTIEFIRCYVCGKPQRIITTLHLKTHSISIAEYKRLYPTAPLHSQGYILKLQSIMEIVNRQPSKRESDSNGVRKYLSDPTNLSKRVSQLRGVTEKCKREGVYKDNAKKMWREGTLNKEMFKEINGRDEHRKEVSTHFKRLWGNYDYRERMMQSREHTLTANTSIERAMQKEICLRGLPFYHNKGVASFCIPDHVNYKYKIAVFDDGDYWHGNPNNEKWFYGEMQKKQRTSDWKTDEKLRSYGFMILRFWESDILSNVKKCVDILEQALMLRGCLLCSGNKSSSRIELTEPALRIKPLLIEDPIVMGRTATYIKEQGTRAVAISRTAEGAEIPLDFTPHTYFNGDWVTILGGTVTPYKVAIRERISREMLEDVRPMIIQSQLRRLARRMAYTVDKDVETTINSGATSANTYSAGGTTIAYTGASIAISGTIGVNDITQGKYLLENVNVVADSFLLNPLSLNDLSRLPQFASQDIFGKSVYKEGLGWEKGGTPELAGLKLYVTPVVRAGAAFIVSTGQNLSAAYNGNTYKEVSKDVVCYA